MSSCTKALLCLLMQLRRWSQKCPAKELRRSRLARRGPAAAEALQSNIDRVRRLWFFVFGVLAKPPDTKTPARHQDPSNTPTPQYDTKTPPRPQDPSKTPRPQQDTKSPTSCFTKADGQNLVFLKGIARKLRLGYGFGGVGRPRAKQVWEIEGPGKPDTVRFRC
jgi:hypothetical protein